MWSSNKGMQFWFEQKDKILYLLLSAAYVKKQYKHDVFLSS